MASLPEAALAFDFIAPAVRRAFVTSVTYTGDLGGVAGGDAKCQELAAAADLPNPTGFVAWLSDSTTDALCHVRGRTGKISNYCGGITPLPGAGPWVRTDGFPFAERIEISSTPEIKILAPLNRTEGNLEVAPDSFPYTGTNSLGALSPGHACLDWSVATTSKTAALGESWATGGWWTHSRIDYCSRSRPLICLETGEAAPLPPHRSGGALAFITTNGGPGDLSQWPGSGGAFGLAAGDAICRATAASANLPAPNTFVAWLSDNSTDAIDRLSYDGPWIRIDGVKIAESKADLIDGTLLAPLNVTQNGVYVTATPVWTGTTGDGTGDGPNCENWTSDSAANSATLGLPAYATPSFTDIALNPSTCELGYHLYCLADFPAILFVDDFESADSAAWTLQHPTP